MNENGIKTSEPTTGEMIERLRIAVDQGTERVAIPSAGVKMISDRLESQEREIERLKSENEAMFRLQMGNQGVYVPDGSEYQPITFFGYPVTDALRKIEEHAALTARAEQAERERDALLTDFSTIERDGLCEVCSFGDSSQVSKEDCMEDCCFNYRARRELPQDGEGK